MADAIEGYVSAVERGEFPADEHSHYEDGLDNMYQ
jgi:3-methyl-2-oxobutanoate hydroxymethyltransferase